MINNIGEIGVGITKPLNLDELIKERGISVVHVGAGSIGIKGAIEEAMLKNSGSDVIILDSLSTLDFKTNNTINKMESKLYYRTLDDNPTYLKSVDDGKKRNEAKHRATCEKNRKKRKNKRK